MLKEKNWDNLVYRANKCRSSPRCHNCEGKGLQKPMQKSSLLCFPYKKKTTPYKKVRNQRPKLTKKFSTSGKTPVYGYPQEKT